VSALRQRFDEVSADEAARPGDDGAHRANYGAVARSRSTGASYIR
jgi:hypothetical protein